MEKQRRFALTGAEKSRVAKLTIVASASVILVFACIMWTIEGTLWAPIPGVIFAGIACVCIEEPDKIERNAKERGKEQHQ